MLDIVIKNTTHLHKQFRYLTHVQDGKIDKKYQDWSKIYDEKHAGKYNLGPYSTNIFGETVNIISYPDKRSFRGLRPILLEHPHLIVFIGINAKNWENELERVIASLVTYSTCAYKIVLVIENDVINDELNLQIDKELTQRLYTMKLCPIDFVATTSTDFDNILEYKEYKTKYTDCTEPPQKNYIQSIVLDIYNETQINQFTGKIIHNYVGNIFAIMESGTLFDEDDLVFLPSKTVVKAGQYRIESQHKEKSYIKTNQKGIIVFKDGFKDSEKIKDDLCITNYNIRGDYPKPTKKFIFDGFVNLDNELEAYDEDFSRCKDANCEYLSQTKNGTFKAEFGFHYRGRPRILKHGKQVTLELTPKFPIYLASQRMNDFQSRMTVWLRTSDSDDACAFYRIQGNVTRIEF